MARRDPRIGLALFGTIANEHIVAQGAGTFASSFTQAGPGPGAPVPVDPLSRFRPTLTGAQSVALTLATIHGGYPGIDGARVVYRLATDTDPRDFRGWSEPNLPTHWDAPSSGWGAAVSFAFPAAAALPNGKIAVVAADDTLDTEGQSWTYSPRTETWTDKFDWSTGAGLAPPLAMAYDAGTGRLIVWSGSGTAGAQAHRAYSSLDEGATWSLYSRGMYGATIGPTTRLKVAVDPGGADWMAIGGTAHLASADRGITWQSVETLTGGAGTLPYVPIRTTAGWLVAYIATGTNEPAVRLLPTPGSLFNGASEIIVSDKVAGDIVGCTDHDGTVYLLCRGTVGATTRHQYRLHRSLDGGLTWDSYFWVLSIGDDTRILDLMDLVPSAGQLHLVYGQNGGASGDVTGTVAVLSFGGWSQVEQGNASGTSSRLSRFTYGFIGADATDDGLFWFPYTLPEAMGWSRITFTGARSFDTSIPGMRVTCTAGQGEVYSFNVAGTGCDFVNGEAILRVTAAGSDTLATIGTGNVGIFLSPRLGDSGGTVLYAPQINIGTDGIRVMDGTTIRATELFDTTAFRFHVRWQLRAGAITVWYRQKGTHSAEDWVRVCNDVTVTSSGTTTSSGLRWGNGTTAVGVCTWGMVGTLCGGDWLSDLDTAAEARLTSEDGVRGLRYGRPVPGVGTGGYPLPEATANTEDLGYLVATGWPSVVGLDSFTALPVEYEQGIRHIDPDQSPSPRAIWSAASDALQSIVYDLGDPMWAGGALAIVALNCKTPTITVAFDDGAGAFAAAVTMDMTLIASWNYTLVGRVLVPRTGTTVLDRYVAENELAGTWCLCSTAGTPVYREIEKNSGGFWTTDTAFQQLRITLTDVDGTEVAAGTGTLFHHSAVMVVYPSADVARRFVRLRAAAVTGGGVPSAGILAVARLVAFGSPAAHGWTRSLELSRTMERAGDGTPAIRRRGPPRQVWSYPWTDGIDVQAVRTITQASAHIGISGGQPIGTQGDGWHSWWALIEGALRSGEVPCVLLPKLPIVNTVITDPTLFVYGLLAAESVSVSSVVGTEGVDEWVRLDSPTIEQIR